MRKVRIEIERVPQTQNQWDRMNHFRRPKLMLEWRDDIILRVGEGPWPKVRTNTKLPEKIREQVVAEIKKQWKERRLVVAELLFRRPKRRFDDSNYIGGAKPMFDGLQFAGWIVSDHPKWFKWLLRDSELGDSKTIIELSIPETDNEEAELKRQHNIRSTLETA